MLEVQFEDPASMRHVLFQQVFEANKQTDPLAMQLMYKARKKQKKKKKKKLKIHLLIATQLPIEFRGCAAPQGPTASSGAGNFSINSSIFGTKSGIRNGLLTTSSIPASSAVLICSCLAFAVTAMIGT